MKVDASEIFERDDDYKDWTKLIRHCQEMDLTASEKEMAIKSFQWLGREFGEEFLDYAFDTRHPICEYITNLAPWTRKWFIWFVETLRECKETMEQLEYNQFKSKLKDSTRNNEFRNNTRFGERVSVLRIAQKFNKTVFDITFDPKVRVLGKPKTPDLKLVEKDTGKEIFVEISATHESEEERDAKRIINMIKRDLVEFHQIWYSGRLKKKLSRENLERELAEIAKKIKETIGRVKKENKFQAMSANDKVELGIAPKSDRESLEKWAAKRGLRATGWTMDYETDEVSRIKQKIRKKQDQLPREHPGIVIIINDIFFLGHNTEEARRELIKELCRYPHLSLVIVAGRFLAPGRKAVHMEGDHYILIDGIERRYLTLFNPFCKQEIPGSTREQILKPFTE